MPATSYIPTTTIAVTRPADVPSYSTSAMSGALGWTYAEVVINTSTNQRVISTGADSVNGESPLYLGSGKGGIYDGTTVVSTSNSLTLNVVNKVSSTWGSSLEACANGGTVATGVFDGSMGACTNLVFNGNAKTQIVRNVYIGTRQLSASEQQAITR